MIAFNKEITCTITKSSLNTLTTKISYCGLILVMRGISINRNIFVVRKDDTKAYLDIDHDREFKVQLLFSLQITGL
jgi:hypothetical protein